MTDFSENAKDAASYALQLYKNEKKKVHFLNVRNMGGFVTDDILASKMNDDVEDIVVQEAIEEMNELLKNINTSESKPEDFEKHVIFNDFVPAVKHFVKKYKIDIVVMGAKGKTSSIKVILGSNTHKVINNIDLPLLIVPENTPFTQIDKIVFPTDYTVDFLPISLLPLLDVLDDQKAELSILYVNKNGNDLSPQQKSNQKETDEIFKDYRHSFKMLSNLDVDRAVSCMVELNDIKMIAMIKKQLTFFQKLFETSTIHKVSHHTKIPLLILPENQVFFD